MNSGRVNKRILRDMKLLQQKVQYESEIIDTKTITCVINGPKDTVYEGGKWKINIEFPDNYPFKSPSVGFLDKIYHPNIDFGSGSICLNVLNTAWTPIYTVEHIVETFLPQLLTYPNPDDPLNIEAANLLNENIEAFNKKAVEYIKRGDTYALKK
tara:strand:+ start:1031 stop:1495 length:465 start_codon:yes stop_codon:yes gene_type:complete